ncbi:MAG: DUF1993 domain-containing protein [Alphaproteobacteria bacterium]|nr:DUF1993 domain-containing protein [Alphaproteobacteria bacterium]
MALSLYETSVATFVRTLTNLEGILDKAAAHATAKKFDSANYLAIRLAPDMLQFNRQIQIATDHAKRASARLAGVEAPVFEDNEKTIDELKARIKKTIDYLKTLKPAQVDGNEDKSVVVPAGQAKRTWPKGTDYLFVNALPNFFFHVTTAYAILRSAGVDIGKGDFIGPQPPAV